MERFNGSFTQQVPISEEGQAAALDVLRHGRLHRYNTAPDEISDVAALEADYADWQGARYCLAMTSGGAAMGAALRALQLKPGEPVLTNAFTLAPVPGAIQAAGGKPVFVGTTEALTIDMDDLAAKITVTGARILMLSHMRGHLCDMDRLMALCDARGVTVIEDCAHTMGARWRGIRSGQHGAIACFSTQTYKHMNSGEGGFLTTDDPDLAARAVLLSGSYMLYERHGAAPEAEVFERVRLDVPNVSSRMDNLRAAILRPQIKGLDADCAAWTERYRVVEAGLRDVPGLTLVERPEEESFVGSSFQFLALDWPDEAIRALVKRCLERGVELKWFGAPEPAGFTSVYGHWRYANPEPMPATDRILRAIVDMRLPLTFSLDDCALIARIIAEEVRGQATARPAAE